MEEKTFFSKTNTYLNIFLWLLIFAGLYIISNYSYIFFHTLAETFSIAIAIGVFIIAWNSRKFFDNNYLLFIGIAYLFIAGIDLVHTLAYRGMNIFIGYSSSALATQLWIAARYFQAISLLIAPVFINRKLNVKAIVVIYALITGGLLTTIFLGFFPITFIEGYGLTQFKIISEYIISVILIGSIFFLWKYKNKFNKSTFYLIIASIILTIFSELAFTFYISVYGLSNVFGHFFKIIAFYLIYKAFIQANLRYIKIKDILLIGAGISIILILVFSLMVYVSFNKVAEENEREMIANEIQTTTAELNIIMYDYLEHREERMIQQWNLKYDISLEIIEKIDAKELEKIQINYAKLKDLFSQITANYEEQGSSELEQRLVSKLLIESHTILFNSARISKEAYNNAILAQKKANKSMMITLAVLFAALLGISLYVTRRITKPLNKLTEGTKIIGKGNLKHRINIESKDEIGELAAAFNKMTCDLGKSRKKLEGYNKELKESNRLKDLFIDIIRHDFLNPAGVIRMNIQMALMKKKSAEKKELLQKSYYCCNKLITTINNVSAISKLESGEKLKFEKKDLSVILRNVVEEMDSKAAERKIKMNVTTKGKFPALVSPLIHDVFSNLVSNAIKYGPEKSEIIIEIKKEDSNWKIFVADRGEGIPDKFKGAVFDRFTRFEKSAIKGSGLGLAIVKKITEVHKGKVWIEDNPGGGSIFIVEIPRVI